MREITTPVGRLIGGHPMVAQIVKDDNNQLKLYDDGTQMIKFYGGLAVPKGQETDWRQTKWGQDILQEALSSYTNNESQSPNFAWKIENGDSTIPNEKGKIPNQREGWPGHWIIHASNLSPMSCYRDGDFNPYNSIQDKNEIKVGDYCQFMLQVKDNKGPKTRKLGMYINLVAFNLVRAGVKIVSVNEPDAAAGFGSSDRTLPANAMVDPNIAAPAQQQAASNAPAPPAQQQAASNAPGMAPAPDFVANAGAPPPPPAQPVEQMIDVNGTMYAVTALRASGWTEAQLIAKGYSPGGFADDTPF